VVQQLTDRHLAGHLTVVGAEVRQVPSDLGVQVELAAIHKARVDVLPTPVDDAHRGSGDPLLRHRCLDLVVQLPE